MYYVLCLSLIKYKQNTTLKNYNQKNLGNVFLLHASIFTYKSNYYKILKSGLIITFKTLVISQYHIKMQVKK